MFTGIIEEIGTMKKIVRQGQTLILTIAAKKILSDLQLGDSVSVNGVCLTVVSFDASSVAMDVMPETYRQTNLAQLQVGGRVNLERAMSALGRFGGHFVQGHVDCTGIIVGRADEENAVVFTVKLSDPDYTKFIIERGSITIDGISLTVISVADEQFQVSIIPHTLQETILADKTMGHIVNLETDMMGKYVYHYMQLQQPSTQKKQTSAISKDYLAEHGFA